MQSSPVQDFSRARSGPRRNADERRAGPGPTSTFLVNTSHFSLPQCHTGHRRFHRVSLVAGISTQQPGASGPAGCTLTRSQASFLVRPEKQIQIIACLLQSLKQAGKLADHDDGTDRRPPWMLAFCSPKDQSGSLKVLAPRDEKNETKESFYSMADPCRCTSALLPL
jgi:hypothetical protein